MTHDVEENRDGSRYCYDCEADVTDDPTHDPDTTKEMK